MLHPSHALAILVMFVSAIASAHASKPVLAQDLDDLEVPGKVTAVLWTRRPDSWTVQVLLPPRVRLPTEITVDGDSRRKYAVKYAPEPTIAVWLLRADGSRIEPIRRWETPMKERECPRCRGPEVLYAFPLDAGREAASVALSVDDGYRTQRLRPFAQ